MENKPKLEPVRLADWAQNSAFFANNELMSETKRPKQLETQSNVKVRLSPIPPSQLQLSFQAFKPSGIGQTPARAVTSIKKKNWNSSVKVVSKVRRMTEIQPNSRKTLNFNCKPKATNVKKLIMDKETPQSQTNKLSNAYDQKLGLKNELSGIKMIPATPRNKIVQKKIQINTPKSILRKKIFPNTHSVSPSPKSIDGDATFLRIEKEVDDMVQEKDIDNEINGNVVLPSSTPFKSSNILEYFPLSSADSFQKDNTILELSNVSENENPVVALCDAFKRALGSHTCLKTDVKQERGSLINVIEVCLKHLQEIEECEKENSVKKNSKAFRKQLMCATSNSACGTNSPKYRIQKKIVIKTTPVKSHVSPEVKKSDALNVYMGLKRNLKFLNTPKQIIETGSPARMKKNLQSQLNRLYSDI